jgi:hypothetical protein
MADLVNAVVLGALTGGGGRRMRKAVGRHRLAMRQNLAPPIVASRPLDSVPVPIKLKCD